ncbi:MAG: rhodanese-like domain-containing protein [Ardenticatenales bacterium]
MNWRSLRLAASTLVLFAAVAACGPSNMDDVSSGGTTPDNAPITSTLAGDDISPAAPVSDTVVTAPTIGARAPLSGKLQEVEPGGPMVAVELVDAFKPMVARPEGSAPVDPADQPPLEDFFVKAADVDAGINAGMEIVWLDARDKLNYDFSHIPGAINAPYFEIADHVNEVPRDKWVVSYCECPHHESGEAAMGLWSAGFRYVKVLEEGFAGWRDGLGKPVDASPKPSATP